MLRDRKARMAIAAIALIVMIATPAFSRSISMKDAGSAIWIFIIVGAMIVLLQLIPAAILFFSFIGTTTAAVFKGRKRGEESAEVAPEFEPAPVKK